MKRLYIIFTILCFTFCLKAQTLSYEVKNQLLNLETQFINYQQSNNFAQMAKVKQQMSMTYWNANAKNDAIANMQEAIDLSNRANDKINQVNYIFAIATMFINTNNSKQAIVSLNQALEISKAQGNQNNQKKCYTQLAEQYNKIGNATKAKECMDKIAEINKKEQDKQVNTIKQEVTRISQEKQLTEQQLEQTTEEKNLIKDSLNIIEELNRKKQLEIDVLNKDKQIQELILQEKENEIKAAKTFKALVSIVAVVVALFIALLIVFLHLRKKKNKLLEEQNIQLEENNEQINRQNQELNQKNEEIENQRQELANKNEQIIDSINYASRIQKSILPSNKLLRSNFEDMFVFFKPRDIVSGDFYWYSKQGDYSFFATVDCTGHSVPGAFMSMIGNTLLNQIVNEKNIYDPAQILTQMDEGVIKTFRPEDSTEDKSEDGMDMTILRYNNNNKEIILSLANHTAIHISGQEYKEIDGDFYSIGGNPEDNPNKKFTNIKLEYKKGDSIYMFSDGYQDQFGGPKGRKFMLGNLEKLLVSIQDETFPEQYLQLNAALNNWMGDRFRQMDDILVVGIKL